MAISLRFIYWIPTAIFFILNMLFKLWIWILQQIGSASVWCNRQFVKAGNWATDKAQNDNGLDNFLVKLKESTAQTKKQVDAKRGRK